MFKSTKSKVLLSLVVAAGLLAGCGAGHQITVSSFGSQMQWRRKSIIKPFQKKTGIHVNPDLSNNPSRFTKLVKSHGKGTDIGEFSETDAVTGADKNVFKKVNTKKLSNFKNLTPGAKATAKQTGGVPFAVSSCGIIYNKKKLGKITSWKQLWTDKKLKGHLSVPPMEQTNGPALLAICGELAGTPIEKDGGKAAFKQLKKLRPQLVANDDSATNTSVSEFKDGHLLADVTSEFNVPKLLQNDKDLAYVVPKGSFTNYDVATIAKGSKNKKADYKFLNYRISKSLQTRDASPKTLNDSPVNKQVKLHGASAKNKTYGKNAKNAKTLNYRFVKKHLAKWITKWDHIIG